MWPQSGMYRTGTLDFAPEAHQGQRSFGGQGSLWSEGQACPQGRTVSKYQYEANSTNARRTNLSHMAGNREG
jgi:hypothetical protein